MDRNNTEQETLALLRADASINEEAGRGSHESFIAEGNPSDEVAEFAQIYNLSHKLDHLRKASLLIQGNTSIHETSSNHRG